MYSQAFFHWKTHNRILGGEKAFRDDIFDFRPYVASIDFHLLWCESHPWEQSLTEPLCWLKPIGPHWQLVSAPPPSMPHLSGEIRARKHCLSDAWNKFPCHINVRSSESESLVEQLPPLPAWQQRRVRFAINLSHLTADSAGYPASTPLFCFVPGSDISCPCENNPEIWPGKRMVQNRSPRLLTFNVYLGQATWFGRKLELQGWSPWGKPAVPPTNVTGTADITTL